MPDGEYTLRYWIYEDDGWIPNRTKEHLSEWGSDAGLRHNGTPVQVALANGFDTMDIGVEGLDMGSKVSGTVTAEGGSDVEGIGRPRVEPSFVPGVIDRMIRVPNAASYAAMRVLERLVGRRYGTVRYLRNRTVEGSLAVFVATLVSVLILSWFYFDLVGYAYGGPPDMGVLFAVSVAGIVTCLEAVTPGEVDNLVIPLVVGGYLHMLGV